MKYIPVKVEENFNISKGSMWWNAVRIITRIVLVVVVVYLSLGLIVDFAVPHIPVSWENSLADPILSTFIDAKGVAPSRYSEKNLQRILNSLVSNIKVPISKDRKFKVIVVPSKTVNALAIPGGYILLYTALLDSLKSENELAMVLAHELGHFIHRDHLKGLGRSALFYFTTILVFGGDNPAARVLLNSSGMLNNTYSRKQETAADTFGLDLLNATYGHAGGAVDFFRKLAKKEKFAEFAQFLSTHPAAKYRVEKLQKMINDKKMAIKSLKPVPWSKAEKE